MRGETPTVTPWTLTASDGTGLRLIRVDAKAAVAGPLAFTELHLYFHNAEDRVREGTFQITLPAHAAVARFAMENDGQWMEAEVVDKALARRAYDDAVHLAKDPALLEKSAGNQFTARVFPIAAKADKHLVISYIQTLAGEPYRLPVGELAAVQRIDLDLAITGSDGRVTYQRSSKRNGRMVPDIASSVAPTAAGVAAGRLVVTQVEVGDRAAPAQPPDGITLLVDTSGSRAVGYQAYLASIGDLVRDLRARWGDDLRLQIVAFDQTTQRVVDGRAADLDDTYLRTFAERGAAGASDVGQALAWIAQEGTPKSRVVIITDGVITAGAEGSALEERVADLARRGVERLDVVLTGELRDDESAARLVRGRLPHAGVVLNLATDSVAEALGEPVSVDVAIEVAHSTWSYPRTIASARPGTTVLVYARLDRPARTLEITAGGRRLDIVPIQISAPLVERAIAGAEVEELEGALLDATVLQAPAIRAELARMSVASRVLSSQTSMLVLETESDYEQYKIDRTKPACTLSVGRSGVGCRARPRVARVAAVEPTNVPAPEIIVNNGEITYGGQLVASTESVLRDDSPTFSIDALQEQIVTASPQRAIVVHVDPSSDVRLVNKLINTATAAGHTVVLQHDALVAAQSNATRASAQAQLDTLRRRQAELQRQLAAQQGSTAATPSSELTFDAPDTTALAGELATIQEALAARGVVRALAVARDWHSREPTNVLGLIGLGEALEASRDDAMAARIYGSIIDLFPGRADLRRFAGERLERIADRKPELARTLIIDTYRRASADRPDHLSGHRLLAYALLRDGKPADAFSAILAGIDGEYRDDSYRGGMRVLGDDAGIIGAAYAAQVPAARTEISRELAMRGLALATRASTRFVVYWETDANDVDFHIWDRRGEHAFYEHKQLSSGGELYADVTTGYGPECFAINGTAKGGPYRLSVHYYARGPMGYGMGVVEIQRFDGKGGLAFEHRPYVVMNDHADVDLGTYTPAR